jgi:predicted exporter
MKLLSVWGPILLLIVLGLVTLNIRFSADIYSLLPAQAPTVEGLKRYQREFSSSHAVIIAINGPDRQATQAGAEQVAQLLEQNQLSNLVVWQSPFREDTAALGELLAYLWINQPAEIFSAMVKRFDATTLPPYLGEVLERIATSFNAEEVGRLAYDPLGLTNIAEALAAQAGGNAFASPDGLFRIVHARCPGEKPGYWQYRDWLDEIQTTVKRAQAKGTLNPELTVRYTGNPVFVREFGSRMLRDLLSAAVSTLFLVMLLFWWAYHRWPPMYWLGGLLGAVLVLTVLGGTLLFGELNAISLGFATILMGLAADYGLIVYQEYRTHAAFSPNELRRMLAPSILWAAATTAGAFLMVARSSLPGLTQLGILVALGILTAAVLVLVAYVPSVQRSVQVDAAKPSGLRREGLRVPTLKPRSVWLITGGLLCSSVLVLCFITPGIDTRVEAMQFKNVEAQQVHDEVQAHIPARMQGSENDLWLIVSGSDAHEVKARLSRAQASIDAMQQRGVLITAHLPGALWPDLSAQQQNLTQLPTLTAERQRIGQQVMESGFDTDSLLLTEAVFDVWQTYEADAASPETLAKARWPRHDSVCWLFDQFASRSDAEVLALGLISIDPSVPKADVVLLAQEVNQLDGVQLVGWPLLASTLAETMVADTRNVILPVALVLVVLLGLAFRNLCDIALSFGTLVLTLLSLTAVMAWLGWHWNLMNMAALPLLLGAGVDYSIHIQLALKRYEGSIAQVHRSVGSAILLCGASTAAAFTSLGLASNPGIASLGRVTAVGIVIATCTAVFLLPGWWHATHRTCCQKRNPDEEPSSR